MSFWGNNTTASADDLKKFTPTKKLANDLWLDEKNELMMIRTKMDIKPKYLLRYDQLITYKVTEGGNSNKIKDTTLRNAFIGSIAFKDSGMGVVLGAMAGEKVDVGYSRSLYIHVIAKNTKEKVLLIPFINFVKVKTNSLKYKEILTRAVATLDEFDKILE